MIATGLLMFGFVAYQLWGTAIETARAQNQLESEFDALLIESGTPDITDADPDSTVITDTDPDFTDADPDFTDADPDSTDSDGNNADPDPTVDDAPVVPVEDQVIPELEDGDALARLEIPRLGRDDIVVAGVKTADLKRGPGHFPDTPLPGQLGNSAIAGHRTTYGQPFYDIDKLEVGDLIIATTLNGRFTYRVTGQEIVNSNEYRVVTTTNTEVANLTLTSCHPKYTARQRIVVFSELVPDASATVGEPVINYGRPDDADDVSTNSPGEATTDAGDDGTDSSGQATTDASGNDIIVVDDPDQLEAGQVSNEVVDAFSDGWFSDPGAFSQVAIWGVLLSAVAILSYLISRRARRDWAGALVGIVPFVITLYFFFQNVNRLLPPNL